MSLNYFILATWYVCIVSNPILYRSILYSYHRCIKTSAFFLPLPVDYVNTMNIYIPQHCRPIFALPTDGYSCPHVPYFFRFSWREQNTMVVVYL